MQLDVSVVNVAVQSIEGAPGGSGTSLQWVGNAYTITLAALILSAGALRDRTGAKQVFVSGFVVVTWPAACGLWTSRPAGR